MLTFVDRVAETPSSGGQRQTGHENIWMMFCRAFGQAKALQGILRTRYVTRCDKFPGFLLLLGHGRHGGTWACCNTCHLFMVLEALAHVLSPWKLKFVTPVSPSLQVRALRPREVK